MDAVIRFPCSSCGKVLRVPERKAGRTITCPVCSQRCVVPEPTDDSEDSPAASAATPAQSADSERAPGAFSRMSLRVRRALAVIAAAGVLGLALALIRPPLPGDHGAFDARWGLLLAGCAFAGFSVILHGHLTGCPACGRWWARIRVESEFVERELFEKNGVPYGRSLYRTTYACGACDHRWTVTEADEYREPAPVARERSTARRRPHAS